MAEAFLSAMCPNQFVAESAGLEPGVMNPLVVEAMSELGFDLAGKETRRVFDVWKSGKPFAYVISVCDEAAGEKCPIFPAVTKRVNWSFRDPSTLPGTPEQQLAGVRKVRDRIKHQVQAWCAEVCPTVEVGDT
jgi:arsenate reductase